MSTLGEGHFEDMGAYWNSEPPVTSTGKSSLIFNVLPGSAVSSMFANTKIGDICELSLPDGTKLGRFKVTDKKAVSIEFELLPNKPKTRSSRNR